MNNVHFRRSFARMFFCFSQRPICVLFLEVRLFDMLLNGTGYVDGEYLRQSNIKISERTLRMYSVGTVYVDR
ncbi:hypothetical protein VNO80_26686 [Phaseolus coccineus]|uniref:Uncharacterized protein n=1 Tax=Phaseolus coccineus TaxID=3886 RepID=A0AAN9LFG9_PHACN